MSRSAFTLRLPAEERQALESLSKVEGRPMNQLLNEAVRIYLTRRGKREQSLSESLDRLRAYRERDPDFRLTLASYGEMEATAGDPLSETVIRGRQDPDTTSPGPVQTKIHDLLRS